MAPHLDANGILHDYDTMALDAMPSALRTPAAAAEPAALDAEPEPVLTMSQAFKHFDRLK